MGARTLEHRRGAPAPPRRIGLHAAAPDELPGPRGLGRGALHALGRREVERPYRLDGTAVGRWQARAPEVRRLRAPVREGEGHQAARVPRAVIPMEKVRALLGLRGRAPVPQTADVGLRTLIDEVASAWPFAEAAIGVSPAAPGVYFLYRDGR